ncbi:bifunctional diaminohydroxyphosphoribosylaminopyrimidine deaminase/5-amino-6-(5-phosphoribosylamino)uracil reductase RibD [Methylobacterium sp. 092160098-2]|jgi:diaminohydroxyphosphoribosylaminopyrimidine deaminase/5-amino-6-(5-phosphoribosylamino)uracil reductase|uniref:bifunctional diaminohydroxyphosphoribosylaminopyrimidine deaminase/5-amino-6-(5-phosphoribosylamino)uracil reductase RibD n=1 Tax=Methylobacterium TaxID=407 RepID=UPI002381C8D8|nr:MULTISPECIES: bifunctional diaminohydroxyphosphoribosylaminopyrimidine deaminase/5-amino-6-(5-phosphoribosylamino)uracil reductase RibD [Methylobacterium]MDE4911481.1 bifunctional diaminohydroxyphosphoribosylaminopyrimidine deaminase/5-amino-6-(5-phosphoribosylamino)uracil reductase RibD [Methylobacterium sp. 092160098-2]MDH3030976.1 bifunctional diaminohydroxyphosphoribosylaminopyrimidine deaminase/5-amino-6-(5-phosphoribosylamino)uracil reductase RibD [Methylobacterium fujisawaense]
MSDDTHFMRLALALGRRGLGTTWPNPSVGAVVVEPGTGRILGTAATARGGRPHGEPVALAAAGDAARGATLYVTLEPCSHHGRTPPCTDAILASGIARVVSALEDPDPRVAGRGHDLLRQGGVAVETGLMRDAAARDHVGHITRVTRGRPALHLKLARTRDGFCAAAGPERLRITGPVADGAVHLWRAHADAILIGIGTARADDPSLTVRLPGLDGRSPLRVVLDTHLRLSPASVLARTARDTPTLVLTTRSAPAHARRALEALGVEVAPVPADAAGGIDLPAALAQLGERGLTRLCSEGGPRLAEALARADLIDTCTLVTGPVELGPAGGLPALGPALAEALAGDRFREAERLTFGPDEAVTYERNRT